MCSSGNTKTCLREFVLCQHKSSWRYRMEVDTCSGHALSRAYARRRSCQIFLAQKIAELASEAGRGEAWHAPIYSHTPDRPPIAVACIATHTPTIVCTWTRTSGLVNWWAGRAGRAGMGQVSRQGFLGMAPGRSCA